MTITEIELSDRQREVLKTLRSGRPYADADALDRLTGAGPHALSTLAKLGFIEARAAGSRRPLYHLTESGREVIRTPEDEDLFSDPSYPGRGPSIEAKENDTMSTTTTEKKKAGGRARSRPQAKKTPAATTGVGKGHFVRHPRTPEEDGLVVSAINTELGDSWEHVAHGLTYGRKWLRYRKGLRTSTPPIGSLSKDDAVRVAKAIDAKLAK